MKDFKDARESQEGINLSKERLRRFHSRFGNDLYVELQMHPGNPEMFHSTNQFAMECAKERDIPLILTNDSHFVNRDDMEAHRAWVATRFRQTLRTMEYVYDDSFYIKSPIEMETVLPSIPEAFDNTAEVNEKIDWIDLNFGVSYIPPFNGLSPEESSKYMNQMVIDEFKARGLHEKEGYRERLREELSFINEHDFSEYFLHLWQATNFARENGIPLGPARGSAAGSIAVNMLGITDIDPIENGLLFSRFLNRGRVHKKRIWTVELESGNITNIVEDQNYHIRDEKGNWAIKRGQDLISEHTGGKKDSFIQPESDNCMNDNII